MFALRSGSGSSSPSAGAARDVPPTVEALRRQARRRLIGAAVLVLAAVIGLPALLESEPRPLPSDIVIEIPARDAVPPLGSPKAAVAPPGSVAVAAPRPGATESAPAGASSGGAAAVGSAAVQQTTSSLPRTAKGAATAAPAASAAEAPSAAAGAGAAAAPAVPAATRTTAAAAAGVAAGETRAAHTAQPNANKARVIVQVGAYEEAARAQEVRQRLERAGLKTYTHVAETPQGKRIRVRVGPFDSRAEAERAAEKVKALGLPAAILTL